MECSEIHEVIEKEACVQTEITVIPEAEVGTISLSFIGQPMREPCKGNVTSKFDFIINQMICLKIPVRFSADAFIASVGIACDNASPVCEPHPCGDPLAYRRYMEKRKYPGKCERSFSRNYMLTKDNNARIT